MILFLTKVLGLNAILEKVMILKNIFRKLLKQEFKNIDLKTSLGNIIFWKHLWNWLLIK